MKTDKDRFIRTWSAYKARQLGGGCFSNDYYSPADIEAIAPEVLSFAESDGSFSYLVRGRTYAKLTVFYDQGCAERLLIPESKAPIVLDLVSKRTNSSLETVREHLLQRGFSLYAENLEIIYRSDRALQSEPGPGYAFDRLAPEDWSDLQLLLTALDPLAANETDEVLLQAVSAGEWPCLRSLENCRPACIIWRQPTDQKEVRLSHLVTRPEERQKGLAARLFDYAFGMEIDRRYVGWVNVHNPARRLYERKGFQYSRKQSQQWLREAR